MVTGKRIIAFIFMVCMLSAGVYAEGNEKGIIIEAESYTKTNAPLTVTENDKMSGGKHVTLSTVAKPLDGKGYYIQYEFELGEAGAYFFTIDSYPVATNSYSELNVSVNGEAPYHLYNDANIGATRSSSKLSAVEVPCMAGFKKGKNTIKITIPYTRPRDNRYTMNIDCITLEKLDWTVEKVEIVGDTATNICEKGADISASIVYSEPSVVSREIRFVLTDYYDETVLEKNLTVKSGDESAEVSLGDLEIGWYKASVYENESLLKYSTLCVVKPLSQRKTDYENERFGVDTTFANLGYKDSIEELCKALNLIGVQWARERLYLPGYTDSEGSYNIKNAGYSEYAYTLLKKYGIKIHAMLTGTPEYLMADEEAGDIISSDLIAQYKMCKAVGDDYCHLVDSWLLQNEPEAVHDLSIYETGDKFHNMMKAMSIGLQDSKSDAIITTAGFTPVSSNILELFFRNEGYEYVDVIPHHGHSSYVSTVPLQTLPHTQTFNVNDIIDKYGMRDIEIWDDEAGINIKFSETSGAQIRQAEYTVISNAQALRYAEKFFTYLFNHKLEYQTFYEVRNNGPRRVVASYSAMTDILGEANYAGDLLGLGDDEYGYVYENGDKSIIVLFASSETEIALPLINAEVIDIQGRNKVPEYDSQGMLKVSLSSEPVYVRVDKESIPENLYEDVTKKSAVSYREELTTAKRVIIAQEYPTKTRLDAKTKGYKIPDDNTTVTVKVSNLNDKAVTGVINGEVSNGWELYPQSQRVTISPYSMATLKYRLVKTDEVIGNLLSGVVFYGEFDAERTTKCETDIYSPEEIDYSWHKTVDGFTTSELWTDLENISGTESTIKVSSDNDTISFKYDFDYNATDLWAYPKYMLDEVIDLSGADGFVIRYEAPGDFRPLSLGNGLYVYEQQGGTWLTKSFIYMSKGQGEILVPFEEFKLTSGSDADFQLTPSDVIGFSLGVNSRLSPSPVRDVPEFKILSFGTYKVETEDTGYSKIINVYPEENEICIATPENIKIEFSDGRVKLSEDTVFVYIDGVMAKTDVSDNMLTVSEMPVLNDGNHTVKIAYRLEGTKAYIKEYSFTVNSGFESFKDLDETPWAKNEIEYLAKNGIINGVENGKFAPDATISFAEFVKMLVNAFEISGPADKSIMQTIADGAWYKEYALAAYSSGILENVYAENFDWTGDISRQDMAVLLYKAAIMTDHEFKADYKKQVFLDKLLFSDYAIEAISVMQTSGILKGNENNYFKPFNSLTRAEAAVAIYNVLMKYCENT